MLRAVFRFINANRSSPRHGPVSCALTSLPTLRMLPEVVSSFSVGAGRRGAGPGEPEAFLWTLGLPLTELGGGVRDEEGTQTWLCGKRHL